MRRDKHVGLIGTVLTLLSGSAAALTISTTVTSDFSIDDDGWVVQTLNGTAPDFNSLFAPGSFTPTYSIAGDDPGGFISIVDPDEGWTYFVAPSMFTGNQSDKVGGTLSFSLQQSAGSIFEPQPPHVALRSGSTVLVLDAGELPAITPAWTSYSAALRGPRCTKSAIDWWRRSSGHVMPQRRRCFLTNSKNHHSARFRRDGPHRRLVNASASGADSPSGVRIGRRLVFLS